MRSSSCAMVMAGRATAMPPARGEWRECPMSDSVAPLGPLGDLPPDVLRRELHRMADWVADYRESIASRAITSVVQPGDVAAGLTRAIPEEPDSLSAVL